ncbi:hypothetical protein BH11PSE13_BH11PSE13_44240 [soil metagenome]
MHFAFSAAFNYDMLTGNPSTPRAFAVCDLLSYSFQNFPARRVQRSLLL